MKSFYKKTLAMVLCLALTTAIVPVTAFADAFIDQIKPENLVIIVIGGEEQYYDRNLIVPGDLMVCLYEPYYTIDDEPRNIAELFPELNIDSFSDINLSVLKASHKPREEWNEKIVAEVGMHFVIHLTEKTVEATKAAIELVDADSRVNYAEPNCISQIGVIPNHPTEPKEITVADALEVLRVAAGLAEASPEVIADFDKDGDGIVTVADALIVLRIAAKLV